MINSNLALLLVVIFILIFIYFLVQSYKFHKKGVRAKAEIISIKSVEELDSEGNEERNDYAKIKFTTKEGEEKLVEIGIGGRYLNEKFKNNLPIIYHKGKSDKPKIENLYNIYKIPIQLLISIVIFVITLILIAKGLETNVLRD